MTKLIILGLLVWGLLYMWRKILKVGAGAPSSRRESAGSGDGPRRVGSGEMVRCAHCGTFVLEMEAVRRDGKVYCTKACSGE